MQAYVRQLFTRLSHMDQTNYKSIYIMAFLAH